MFPQNSTASIYHDTLIIYRMHDKIEPVLRFSILSQIRLFGKISGG
jgi:hypothetical protein